MLLLTRRVGEQVTINGNIEGARNAGPIQGGHAQCAEFVCPCRASRLEPPCRRCATPSGDPASKELEWATDDDRHDAGNLDRRSSGNKRTRTSAAYLSGLSARSGRVAWQPYSSRRTRSRKPHEIAKMLPATQSLSQHLNAPNPSRQNRTSGRHTGSRSAETSPDCRPND